ALMEAEDLAMFAVRGELRQLRQLAEQYKIQIRQVELAYLVVENSLDTFLAPPSVPPTAGGGPVTDSATRAAALTQQLLGAQAGLPRAQTALLMIWVNYITERYQLYRDMELMPLDNRGVWIDDNATSDHNAGAGCRTSENGAVVPADQRRLPERLPEP